MNKLIMLPLGIIIFCAILTQSMKVQPIGFTSTNTFIISNDTTNYNTHSVALPPYSGRSGTENTNPKSESVPSVDIIGFDGVLALLIAFIAISAVAGITVLGSGISNSAQNVLYKSVFFYSIWGIFSVLGYGLGDYGISSIPVFGSVIYIVLTLVYVVGVQSQINTHDSD